MNYTSYVYTQMNFVLEANTNCLCCLSVRWIHGEWEANAPSLSVYCVQGTGLNMKHTVSPSVKRE